VLLLSWASEEGALAPWIMKFDIFYYILEKKVVFLVRVGQRNFTTFDSPWKNLFVYFRNNPPLPPLEKFFQRPRLLYLGVLAFIVVETFC